MVDIPGVGLYFHIPFCKSKCAYCDFNSYAGAEQWYAKYHTALLQEFTSVRDRWPVKARSVYFGGGTPTVLPAEYLIELLNQAPLDTACNEVSVEANPGTVSSDALRLFRRAGTNRISLGMQSLDDRELALLGRIHDRETAIQSFQLVREAGFANVNVDLIFGLPMQTLGAWRKTLDDVLLLEPEHIALYALTLEHDVSLGQLVAGGSVPPPDDDAVAEMYEWSAQRLHSAGYEHYEISNWALPGKQCAHNLIYWHNEPYLGLGAGAWSYWQGRRSGNVKAIEAYITRCNSGSSVVEETELVSLSQEMADTLILGLRLVEGVRFADFEARFGLSLQQRYGSQIESQKARGLLEVDACGIRLTGRGRLLGNEVFEQFLVPG